MKKTLSALAGLSLMVAPIAGASASVRPATAIPTAASSAIALDDHNMDESDNDELFILGVMAGVLVIVALAIFNSDDSPSDNFVGGPVSGG